MIYTYDSIDLSQFHRVTCHSGKVKPGMIFIAIRGHNFNGQDYIADAVKNGASAIVYDGSLEVGIIDNIEFIQVENARHFLSYASRFFYPKQPKFIAAVTGTDGKTSTTHFCQQIWNLLREQSAVCIGTQGMISMNNTLEIADSGLTTPDAESFYQILNALSDFDYCAFESSSIGLEQFRTDHIIIDAAVFTNIHEDHIDVHGNYESYLDAKIRLFEDLLPHGKTAILHDSIPCLNRIIEICHQKNCRIIIYGSSDKADFRILKTIPTSQGQEIIFMIDRMEYSINIPLYARFHADNILAAIAVITASGYNLLEILDVLHRLQDVNGRMERISDSNVYVDYAHTENGLLTVLSAMRERYEKVAIVFGCGGDRDNKKRSKMGRIASEVADWIVVTDDNPRTEDPSKIREEIISGICKSASNNVIKIGNRTLAIKYAIERASIDGIGLIIAGKGHENYQIIGKEKIEFSDKRTAEKILNKIDDEINILWTQSELKQALNLSSTPSLLCHPTGISIDTRTIVPGDIFIAIRGKHLDGHDYIKEAISKGASCIVSSDRKFICNGIINVDDTVEALIQMGDFSRKRMKGKVIGITGSIGKTTTKEMLKTALINLGKKVYATYGTYNNHIGVPYSLASVARETEIAIIESGISHPGDMMPLARLIAPDIVVITKMTFAHLAQFLSIEKIAHEKAVLLDHTKSAVVISDMDDNYSDIFVERALMNKLEIIKIKDFDIETIESQSKINIKIKYNNDTVQYSIPCRGTSFFENSLNVIGVLLYMQLAEKIPYAIFSNFDIPFRRGEIHKCTFNKKQFTIIDDSWNAHPLAMKNALENLANIEAQQGCRKIAALGDMKELGGISHQEHVVLLQNALSYGFYVFSYGDNMRDAIINGVIYCETMEEMQRRLSEFIQDQDVLLIKGSMVMQMWRILDFFRRE